MTEKANNFHQQLLLPVGTLLQGGKYRIDNYLSSGGFGNTYVATITEFNEQIAIKEFFIKGVSERDANNLSVSVSNEVNFTSFNEQKEKFKKEARRLRKLRNDHIVAVHDLFEENGTAYYVMDFINGESLSAQMKRTGRPIPEQDLQSLFMQMLDALETVHEQHIWHLDIKPANIMIDKNGYLRLIDFGASKQLHNTEGNSVSTSSALAYTPGYAPLEQCDHNLQQFGPWTDFYALGATLYNLLTGKTPPSPSAILTDEDTLAFPENISVKMQELIKWLMAPAYKKRPQTVQEIRDFMQVYHGTGSPHSFEGEETIVIKEKETVPATSDISSGHADADDEEEDKEKSRSYIVPLIVGIVIAGIIAGVIFISNSKENPVSVTPVDSLTNNQSPTANNQSPITNNHSSATPDIENREMGIITVKTTPKGASVYIDGKVKGKTPLSISNLAVGTHHIKLTLEDYQSIEEKFIIKASASLEINKVLKEEQIEPIHKTHVKYKSIEDFALTKENRSALRAVAKYALAHPDLNVYIIAYLMPTSNSYAKNMTTLGKRTEEIANYLTSLGVERKRMVIDMKDSPMYNSSEFTNTTLVSVEH
ncbi:MAG: protein kinase [Prevotella sp.]|nr:protein kinase [Prevotella sp.]